MNLVHENNSRPTAGPQAPNGTNTVGFQAIVGTAVDIMASILSTWQKAGSRPDTSPSQIIVNSGLSRALDEVEATNLTPPRDCEPHLFRRRPDPTIYIINVLDGPGSLTVPQ
jgi:hypothetical protein